MLLLKKVWPLLTPEPGLLQGLRAAAAHQRGVPHLWGQGAVGRPAQEEEGLLLPRGGCTGGGGVGGLLKVAGSGQQN